MPEHALAASRRLCGIRRSPTKRACWTYKRFSRAPIVGPTRRVDSPCRGVRRSAKQVFRYVLAFSLLFVLGIAAGAAAIAADVPAFGQVAFVVCIALFAAALANGVADRRSSRVEQLRCTFDRHDRSGRKSLDK